MYCAMLPFLKNNIACVLKKFFLKFEIGQIYIKLEVEYKDLFFLNRWFELPT